MKQLKILTGTTYFSTEMVKNYLSLLQKRAVRTPSSIHVYRKVLGSKRAKLERIFLSRQMLARVRASRRYQAL